MILASSGPPGGALGGLLGCLGGLLGASWAVLGHLEAILGRLGLSWAVLEAVLDHLGRTWRPSWTILEAILGQRGHLGGHLEPSWRIFWGIELLGNLSGTPAGRAGGPGGVILEKNQNRVTCVTAHRVIPTLLLKEPKPKPRGSSTPGTPVMNQQGAADLVALGPTRHRAWAVSQEPLR